MDRMLVDGPAKLKGTVQISGAKNAALPILAATIIAKGEFVIRNVPEVSDVFTMVKILKSLGAKVTFSKNVVSLDTSTISRYTADYRQVSTMRASVCLLGPLLSRFGKARVSMPGGCVIGPRPIDLHLKGLCALGAHFELEHGYVVIETKKKLKGKVIYLGGAFGSSVLASANIMTAAVLAGGTTVIENAACEPEVVDLGEFLIRMGAKIRGLGSPRIEIEGVQKLYPCEYSVIHDRIEAGTYIIAAALTNGDVTVKNAQARHLTAFIDKLREAGVLLDIQGNAIRVRRKSRLRPISVTTFAYPGFPTDLQAQMTALMCVVPGISVITEKIFPERFMHVSELSRMGARIQLEGASAIVSGAGILSGAPVMASDLRASAALVLAALASKGKSEISRIYHLDRGYEKLGEKLRGLGARIRRVTN